MDSPLISIIVPVYNIENYIAQCVDSICKQTYRNLEIILIDDGSKDKSGKICDVIAKNDKRIHVIHKVNEGVVTARKTGVEYCTGEYVLFVDGDDWIDKDMIDAMVSTLSQKSVDLVICGLIKYIDDKSQVEEEPYYNEGCYEREHIEKMIFPKMIYTGEYYFYGVIPAVFCKLYKKSLIANALEQVDSKLFYGEDAISTYALITKCKSVYILKKCYYFYRYRETSVSHVYNNKLFDNLLLLHKNLLEVTIASEDIIYQINYFIYYNFVHCLVNEVSPVNSSKFIEKINKIKKYSELINLSNIVDKLDLGQLPCKHKITVLCLRYRFYYLVTIMYFVGTLFRNNKI